ncbi:hypothetical protein C8Q70DRAFT_935871 [Cubamyces menziesii]|nr:hypothetical protein C8Q70DRAFT_935871 [Cubamyces menziesii]
MPPPLLRRLAGLATRSAEPANVQPYFAAERASWLSPDDTLSILMIIGGDIVQRAVAQLAGSGLRTRYWDFAPVAFSFGWLAYSVSALTSAVGDGRLLPQPDCAIHVINAKTGYRRQNASWVLGRLVRDHEKDKREDKSLNIAFYHTVSGEGAPKAGKPTRDWVYWCGVFVIFAQLAIAIVPGASHGNWIVLVVTVGGTVLALLGSGLPQWREEKYAARTIDKGPEVVCLTRGNGSTYAMVVISKTGLRLEDLAGGRDKRRQMTSVMSAVLTVLWVVLLLTVEGLDGDAWYLLAIGGLGMVQNVVAAGAARSAGALGIHFAPFDKTKDVVCKDKVMDSLMEAEERQAGVGLAMLKLFFPGDLRPREQEFWDMKKAEKSQAAKVVIGNGNSSSPMSETNAPQSGLPPQGDGLLAVPGLQSVTKTGGGSLTSDFSEKSLQSRSASSSSIALPLGPNGSSSQVPFTKP